MLCPNCQTINPPNAKFCLECGTRLTACPNCGTVNPPGAKFCIECGTPLQPRRDVVQSLPVEQIAAGEGTQPMQPVIVAAQQGPFVPSLEERRVVTVMFADITGSTPLADRLDPEDMRAILTGYFNLMTEQIRKHDGTVEKYIGDAVMAVFGTPVAHEDDPDRAIRAALDMQVALTTFNTQRLARDPEATRLQMRIGINTGEVAAPSNTAPQHQDFLITGDAVNIAARLQQMATPDTILVGERTYLSTRDVVDFKSMAPLHLKGKPEPVSAYVVQDLHQPTTTITQHPRGIAGRWTPMVGRSLELTLLHASYARVQAERRPHLITILGTPGVGKSRLVREFINREQELAKSASSAGMIVPPLVLKGRCPSYGEGITYWPLIEILRTLLHVQESDTTEALQQRFVEFLRAIFLKAKRNESPEQIAETLLRHVGRGVISNSKLPFDEPTSVKRPKPESKNTARTTDLKQSGAQGTLLRAWRVLFETLAELQPLIIVVDDLQWADEALLELLEYLTDRITTVPILFLCPARPDFLEQRRDWGGGHRNFTAIELDSLTWEESSELVDALLNASDLPEALRYTILTRAEGNPFFVEEIVRMFIDQGILVQGKDHEQYSWHIESTRHPALEERGQHNSAEHTDENVFNSHVLVPLPHVPDTIQGVLAARIDLLAPTEKLILQHCSIIGRTFWLSTLLELAEGINQNTVLEALVSLMRRDFILEVRTQNTSPMKSDSIFGFKHILIRNVVYNNIPRQRRSYEHARLALWLDEQTVDQQENFIELIAYQYQRALATWSNSSAVDVIEIEPAHHSEKPPIRLSRADLRERAIKYLTMTGDQALHSYSGPRALRAYDDAFELLNEGQAGPLARSKMLAKVAEAQTLQGNLDVALRHSRNALKLATAEGIEADKSYLLKLYEHLSLLATRWLGRFDDPPDPQEIRSYIDAGLQILAGTPISREYITFLTYEAFWYVRQLDEAPREQKNELIEQALQSGYRALSMAEELNNPRTLSLTLDAMGLIYLKNHSYAKAKEMQERRLQLVELISDKEELYDLYVSLGIAYEQIDEYASALTCYGKSWSNALTMESPVMVLDSMVGRMRAWRRWNRWDNALHVAQEILQFIERYQQDEKRQRWALETLAVIAYYRGNQEEGDHYTRQYRRLIDQKGTAAQDDTHSPIDTKLHAMHFAQADWKRATADYLEKVRLNEPFPSPSNLSTLAELAVTTGGVNNPEALCDRAVTLCETSGAPKSLAVALRARGHLYIHQQNWIRAEEDLRRSLQNCEKLDLPWERAHTLYYLGLLYKYRSVHTTAYDVQASDQQLACYYLEQALGFYQSLDATPSVEQVRAALKEGENIS